MQSLKGSAMWVLFILIFLALLPNVLEWFERFELYTLDARQISIQEDRTQVSPISLIEVDEQSISAREVKQAFDRYPYRREIFGYLVRFLERGEAKRLIMDMAFTGGADLDHPDSDLAFARSIDGKLKVTSNLATLKTAPDPEIIDFSKEELEKLEKALSDEWLSLSGPMFRTAFGVQEPVVQSVSAVFMQPSLNVLMDTSMSFYPFDNLVYDLNGKARRCVLFSQVLNKGILPTLPVSPLLDQNRQVTLREEGVLTLGDHQVDLKGESVPIIRWYGNALLIDKFQDPVARSKAKVYPRYPFWKVVKSQIYWECQQDLTRPVCKMLKFRDFEPLDPIAFRGRYVFLGLNTVSYDMDNHPTLYDRESRKYPGVFIQANILDNILHNDFVGRAPWRVPLPGFLQVYLSTSHIQSVSLVTLLTVLILVWVTQRVVHWASVTLGVISLICLGVIYHYLCFHAYREWNIWLNWIYPMTGLLASFLVAFTARLVESEKKKQQLRIAFGKYFPKDILEQILKDPNKIALGGKRLAMTFLFCDIRGFTTFAENNDTSVVQEILNDYYTTMHTISQEHQGTAFKFLGDGILTFWGFPVPHPEDALNAVKAALAMQKRMVEWQQTHPEHPIKIGIGVNTGEAFFGNVGTEEYMDFTVIGDNVNIAARLEQLNKTYNTSILVSQATYEAVKDHVIARALGEVDIRGKEMLVAIYEVTSLKG